MLRRYLLFMGHNYYPSGGWNDFEASFDTLKDAMTKARDEEESYCGGWWQIVDLRSGELVDRGSILPTEASLALLRMGLVE
jgi:hypothetical protein